MDDTSNHDVPGTEIMAESAEHGHLVHADNVKDGVVLIPQPSQSPQDPLNWSRKWKTIVLANQCFFVVISIVTALSIAPLTPIYIAEWHKTPTQIALLTGVVVITLGYANFIIIPCANLFGRRPVLLVCCIITLVANIWQALAKSYGSFLAARAIFGIGSAANESIMMIVVTDVFFLHERGRLAGLYFWCYFIGLMIGPIIAGNIAARVSWRWFFWACTIAQAANLGSLLFFFPETRRLQEAIVSTTPTPESMGMDAEDTKNMTSVTRIETVATVRDQFLGQGKPSRSQMKLWQALDRKAWLTIFHHIITPIEIFFFPIIFWAAMTTGAAANTLLCINLLQSEALSAPPYNFSPAGVGFANFALVGGAMVALATAGPSSDWIAMRLTKKNRGIREAEMRLAALIPYIILAVVGLTVVGVGLQKSWPWEVVIVIGFGMAGVITVALPTIAITYAVDSYRPISGQIMVIATVVKNTFGFGMTYFINDWAAKAGFVPPLMLMLGMTVGFSLIGLIVLQKWGKKFRQWTKYNKVHSL